VASSAKRAVRALRERRWDDARRLLDAAVAERPHEAELLFQRARALHGAGDGAAALADLERALALDSDHARALCLRATLGVQQRPIEQCLADLDRAIALEPDFANAYLVRAQLRARLGRGEDAAADLNRALELRPDSVSARRARVRHLLARGDAISPQDARRALSDLDVLIATREEAGLHYERARALRALGCGEEAEAALTQVIALTSPLDALQRAARAARAALWRSGEAAPPDPVSASAPTRPRAHDDGAAAVKDDFDAGAAERLQRMLPPLRVADGSAQRVLRRSAVRRIVEQLRQHGYQPHAEVTTAAGAAKGAAAAIKVLTSADGRTSAWVKEPLARRGGVVLRRKAAPDTAPQVELITTLDDGGFVVTSASDGPPPREIPRAHDCRYLIPGTEPDIVLRRHAEATDARIEHSPGVDVVLAYDLGTALDHYERRRVAVYRHMLAEGLIDDSSPHTGLDAALSAAAGASAETAEPYRNAGVENEFAALLTVMAADWQDGLRPGLHPEEIDALMAVLGEWGPPAVLAQLYAYRDGQESGQEPFMPGLRLLPLAVAVSAALDLAELSGPPLLPLLRGEAGAIYAVLSPQRDDVVLYRERAGEPFLAPAFDSPAQLIETVRRCHAGGAYYREGGRWREAAELAEAIRRRVNPGAAQRRGGAVARSNPATWPESWLARIGLKPVDLKPRGATVSTTELRAWTFGQWPEPAVVRGRVEAPERRGIGARFLINDGAGRLEVVCKPPWQLFVRAGAEVEVRLVRPQRRSGGGDRFEARSVVPLGRNGRPDSAPGAPANSLRQGGGRH